MRPGSSMMRQDASDKGKKIVPSLHAVVLALVLLAPCLAATGAPAFDVTGTVVAASGDAVPGASVWLVQEKAVRRAESGTDGSFTFEDVPMGYIELVARKDGYALGGLDSYVIGSGAITLTLAEPDVARLRVVDHLYRPVAGARVKGLVVNDAFHVSVADLSPEGFPSIRSDEEGAITISDVPKNGYVGFNIAHRRFAELRAPYLPVGLDELTLQLHAGIPLRGRVADEAGAGVGEARVSVFILDYEGQHEVAETVADREGFYTALVAPGTYWVATHHADHASPLPVKVLVAEDDAEKIRDLKLLEPHRLEGRVLMPDEGPAVGVRVAYLTEDTVCDESLTDSEGTFRLNAASGKGRVRALAPPGYIVDKMLGVTIQDEPVIALGSSLVLQPMPEVKGRVQDRDGSPVPGALIVSLDVYPPVTVIADGDGAFQFKLERAPLDPKVHFRAEHPRRFLQRHFEVNLDKLRPVTVKLKPFEPDTKPLRGEWEFSPLAELLQAEAPPLECSQWLNLPEGAEPPTLEGLRGKVVILTFWGGFDTTGPGRRRIEELNTLHELFVDADDVAIIGIHDSGSVSDDIARYVTQYGIRFPVGVDVDEAATFEAYRAKTIPQTILIGKDGTPRYIDIQGRLLELVKALRLAK
jgi:peroxiredoxin